VSPTPVAGKRKAARHSGARGPLFSALPSAPVLAGVATLAVAVGGAVSSGDVIDALPQAAAATGTGAANALNGSSKISQASLLGGRETQVSRDSARETLAEAADKELVQEAEAQARQRNAALAAFAKKAEVQAAKIEKNLWVMPLSSYRLSAGFGETSYLWASIHTGLDLSAPSGTQILAVANGTVTEVGYDGSYGNKTVVTLEDGTEIWFCHQTSYAVEVGDTVTAGEVIGYVGSTGNTTGPHLHLEVRPGGGDPVDPFAALVAHGLNP
jgi:murein DD-endopeptidase MepM/ murein hydrolase activator NlpD